MKHIITFFTLALVICIVSGAALGAAEESAITHGDSAPAFSPATAADALLIQQIDEFLSMTRDEIIGILGPDFEEVGAGPEGAMDGYYYEDLGMAFAFYPDSHTPEIIHCYPEFTINGVGMGNLFSEIIEALGPAEIMETWLELPIYTTYTIEYTLGNNVYCFIAFEEDGPAEILWIYQRLSE